MLRRGQGRRSVEERDGEGWRGVATGTAGPGVQVERLGPTDGRCRAAVMGVDQSVQKGFGMVVLGGVRVVTWA